MTLFGHGRPREAIEAAGLGVLAYFAAIIAGFAGWTADAPASWPAMSVPWTAAALVQLAILVWACADIPEQATPQPVSPTEDEDISLGHGEWPLVLVDVSAHGRIRNVVGPEDMIWPDLAKGRIVDAVLPPHGASEITSPKGVTYEIIDRVKANGGRWVALIKGAERQNLDANPDMQDLRAALLTAEETLKERTAFFAGLGHDLKTPLNAILGFADLMKAEVRGPMPEAYKDYPAIIHESGQDLMLLVEDILDLAKAEANAHRLELEPVDLVASAASVLRQLADQAERAGVTLNQTGDAEVWAEADPRAVRQIWQNLVSNAVKYSAEGDTVTLSAGQAAGAVFLSVRDRGAGMDQEDLDRIAKPFAQGTNSKGRAGTGLGLAVVQRFAELHGGQVIIDTAPGKGTRVRVTLPAAVSDAIAPFGDAAQ
ncbi:MAG: HAMP domain-containing sensor histidine kinase [Pseudomonadota bacterium]